MNYKLMGIFLGVAFALYYVAAQPGESWHILSSAISGVGEAAATLADYVRRLVR
jgi:hypothetical protein